MTSTIFTLMVGILMLDIKSTLEGVIFLCVILHMNLIKETTLPARPYESVLKKIK